MVVFISGLSQDSRPTPEGSLRENQTPALTKQRVETPVLKWVAIPSCKSCDGLATTDKEIVDKLFQGFEANAKVKGTKLRYALNVQGDDGSVNALHKNKSASCNAWARFFGEQAGAQGVTSLQLRGLVIVQKTHPDTNFNDEVKWTGILTQKAGMNNTQPGMNLKGVRLVNAGKYAQSNGATASGETTYAPDPFRVWAMQNHAVAMLPDGNDTWLYDTSFGGKVKLAGFSIPAANTTVGYGASHVLRTSDFDSGGHFSHVQGDIMIERWYGNAVLQGHVPVGDQTLTGAKPTQFYIKWKM